MKKNSLIVGLLALVLAMGLVFVGCETDNGGGGDELPAPSGANELSGKTYFDDQSKIVFSTTVEGASNGKYSIFKVKYDDVGLVLESGKYTYVEIAKGDYSWNKGAKTVILAPEEIAEERDHNEYGPLQTKSEYRKDLETELKEYTDAFVLERTGMSKSEYIEYKLEEFANTTNKYAVSSDDVALFLDKPLPKNNGTNELKGKEFTTKDGYKVTFTEITYSAKDGETEIETGEYRYNTSQFASKDRNVVYLKALTKAGKTVADYYDSLSNSQAGSYKSAADAKAAQANSYFLMKSLTYNLLTNTIAY